MASFGNDWIPKPPPPRRRKGKPMASDSDPYFMVQPQRAASGIKRKTGGSGMSPRPPSGRGSGAAAMPDRSKFQKPRRLSDKPPTSDRSKAQKPRPSRGKPPVPSRNAPSRNKKPRRTRGL